MLIHGAPSDTCTVADVMGTLSAADAEDFRWALNMLDKVMPDASSAVANASAITEALEVSSRQAFSTRPRPAKEHVLCTGSPTSGPPR